MSTPNADLHQHDKTSKVEFQYWSDLPADLLRAISKKLSDISDFVYFRAVCKSWRTVTSVADLPPQIPWVMEETGERTEYLRFYSLLSDVIYTIHCPKPHAGDLMPSHGYLYTSDYHFKTGKHALLNPLIKHEVALQFKEIFCRYLVSMSPGLIEDGDYMAFMNNDTKQMEFYQPHKSTSDYIRGPYRRSQLYERRHHACCKGMHFMHDDETCNTEVFDIARGTSFVVPPLEIPRYHENVYFVESEGSILRIVQNWNWDIEPDGLFVSDIYRLDVEDKKQCRWIKIDGIGNQILFLEAGFSSSGISITSRESTELMRNSIYYLETQYIYRYDIKTRWTEIVPCPFLNWASWFVAPSLIPFPSPSQS